MKRILCLLAAIWLALPALSQNAAQVAALSRAMDAVENEDWPAATEAAGAGLPGELIAWHRLRAGEGTLGEARAFLADNGDWPGLKLLRKRMEGTIAPDTPAAEVLAYFADQPPQTGHGALQYARALTETGAGEEAEGQVVLAWISMSLSEEEEEAFKSGWRAVLRAHHWNRLDMLLWRGLTEQARRMLPLVDADRQKLAEARIGLRRKVNGVDALIAGVPAALKDDPGLAYERFLWRASKGRNDDAVALLLERSVSAISLGNPGRWASWRRVLARWLMREGRAEEAYRLATAHYLSGGANQNDLEWLAGYLALRKLDKPELALEHFRSFRLGVQTPISLGRAGYWEGRAQAAVGNEIAAQAAYEFGAEYQTSFYGQLAGEAAGLPMDPDLAGTETFPPFTEAEFWNSELMEAVRLWQAAGERYWARRFVVHLADAQTREGIGQLADWAGSVNEPHLQVMLAKNAARKGWVIPGPYFPTPDIGRGNRSVPRALELSIARRESEFDPSVVSGAGAMGLMQLMPGTARDMAAEVGLSYDKARLTTDMEYNTRLGSEYLAALIERFDGNPVLIAAGYNAGPTRSVRWSELFGDVRVAEVDIVDWIEHIPFRETRNYVMRVTESLAVYRARLTGKVAPLSLSRELKQ
ncbi:lytic transglycosylase domain-containing protein [Aliiroseovarius sp.]|uniref:lytic transglycosylase domain-containing protein n=1 Tax=Aliiroseovarius sp. TaxID=1872442 RepID=UPI0026373EB8|nr:lytic transglycosylase domain-containing protein [Aliiroseovarius sp.]